jgi:hypothetical protein
MALRQSAIAISQQEMTIAQCEMARSQQEIARWRGQIAIGHERSVVPRRPFSRPAANCPREIA